MSFGRLPTYPDSDISFQSLVNQFDYVEPVLTNSFNIPVENGSLLSLPWASDDWRGVCFGNKGKYAYFANNERSLIYVYSLAIPYHVLDSRTFVGFVDVSAQESDVQGIAMSIDGLKLFMIGSTLGVSEWTLDNSDVQWDISQGITYSGNRIDLSAAPMLENAPVDLHFKPDGSQLFALGSTNDAVYVFDLDDVFSLAGARYVGSFEVKDESGTKLVNATSGITFSSSGRKMYIAGTIPDNFGDSYVAEFRMHKPYDPINAVYSGVSTSYGLPAAAGSIEYTPYQKIILIGTQSQYQMIQINLDVATSPSQVDISKFYSGGDYVPVKANVPTRADQTRIDLLDSSFSQQLLLPTRDFEFLRGGKYLHTNTGASQTEAKLYRRDLDSNFDISNSVLADSADIKGDLGLSGFTITSIEDSAWQKFSHDSLGVGDSYPVSLSDLTPWTLSGTTVKTIEYDGLSNTFSGALTPAAYKNYSLISKLTGADVGAISLVLAYNEIDSDGFAYENTLSLVRRPSLPGDSTEVVYGETTFLASTTTGNGSFDTYSWTVPAGVNYVSAVAVAAGGGATGSIVISGAWQSGDGGGGGGLAWAGIPVTPGETLTIRTGRAGAGTTSSTSDAGSGGESAVIQGGVFRVRATGGSGARGSAGGGGPGGNLDVGDGGGAGGSGASGKFSSTSSTNTYGGGGGGAAGYGGNGGSGGSGGPGFLLPGGDGSKLGGAGGGGGPSFPTQGGNGGGGLGIFGRGVFGAGGALNTPGKGGSGGADGVNSTTNPVGGDFGGGGGGAGGASSRRGGNGGRGAVRLVYGYGRKYPSTNLQDGFDGQGVSSYSPYSVIYNYKQNDEKIIKTAEISDSNEWFNNECIVDVTRDSNDFVITSTAIEETANINNVQTITFSLDSDPVLSQFVGEKKIGIASSNALYPAWSDFRFNDINISDTQAYRNEFGGVTFNANGDKFITSVNTYEKGTPDVLVASEILQYSLLNKWDIGNPTASAFQINPYYLNKQTSLREVYGLALGPDSQGIQGKRLFAIVSDTNSAIDGHIHQYELSAPTDLSSATLSKTLTVSGHSNSFKIKALEFVNDGAGMLVAGESGIIKLFNLSVPYDVSTATFDSTDQGSQFNTQLSEINGIFSDELKDVYINGIDGLTEKIVKLENSSFQPISLKDFHNGKRFKNANFKDGGAGWTGVDAPVVLGVDSIGGFITPVDSDEKTLTSTSNYSHQSHVRFLQADDTALFRITGKSCVEFDTYATSIGTGEALRGPYIISDDYVYLAAGEYISFDWRVLGEELTRDAPYPFAYLLKDDGSTQIILDTDQQPIGLPRPDSKDTGWYTYTTKVNSSGNYKFVFVSGVWDKDLNGPTQGSASINILLTNIIIL